MDKLPLGARHRPSGLNSRFAGGELAFGDYVAHCRDMIARARTDAATDTLDRIIDGNAPFELRPVGAYPPGQNKPYRRGILLIHGLTDSPYFMRHLAAFFQQNGFCVQAVLLPGHGTRPGDLLAVNWREWASAVAWGAGKLAAEADELYLGGYSAGGALGLYHSLNDARVRGLFLFSPALEISHRAARANWHKPYSWLMPRAAWVSIMPDRDPYKYESLPKNAAAQMYALTRALGAQLAHRRLDIPVFAATSLDDATVEPAAVVDFMLGLPDPRCKLVLYTADAKTSAPDLSPERVERVHSAIPDQKILSAAHTSIVLPPEDAHYGANGDYANCLHYYPHDMAKYAACTRDSGAVWRGEITDKNLAVGTLCRLMYNPHFAALKISMQQFISALDKA
jgi:esterase/lipase